MSEKDSIRSSKVDLTNPQVCHVKQLTPKRWKHDMIEILQTMIGSNENQKNLVKDLITIVSIVPQANFIQAALQARPFKPEFVEQPVFKGIVTQSTTASTIARVAKFKDQKIKSDKKLHKKQHLTEKNLKQQFNKDFHPFRFIIKNFRRLLELKYKQKIDVKKLKVNQIQKMLWQDLGIFTQFLSKSSMPYRKLFKNNQKNQTDQQASLRKIGKFIQGYIFDHPKLNQTCHKILLYSCRAQYQQFLAQKIQDFAIPEQFDIPTDFRIDGCYIRSMNSLMQFSQTPNHKTSMTKLLQFRANILKDIDEYYANNKGHQQKDLEVSAEIQIEIIRFIVGKLKGWSCQIYSQLKYLQLIYGDEQIAYKYEQGSFMYTQLILAFQILGIEQ